MDTPSADRPTRYAKVAVDMSTRQKVRLLTPSTYRAWDAEPPLLKTFHYRIPPLLETKITTGQLVWVPFGRRQTQGIVVGFDSVAPVPDLQEITRIVDDKPVLTPAQIELARWMSNYYMAPLFDTLSLMLPVGLVRRAVAAIEVVATEPAALEPPSAEQQAALAALREAGPMPLERAREQFGQKTIQELLTKGLAVRRDLLPPPRVRPKTAAFIRLLTPPEQIHWESLGRQAAKRRAILEALSQRNEPVAISELRKATGCSSRLLEELQGRGWVAIEERHVWRDPLAGREFVLTSSPRFTPAQEQVWQRVAPALNSDISSTFLIHGVTGSGKTEIYLRAVQETLKRGRQAIVLVPEISLTPQTLRRFAARFPGRLAVIHSGLSAGERYDQWRRLRDGLADVVIGPRSALFSPLARLGLIILDEEHESSYKQEPIPGRQMPCYHARDVAVKLGQLTGATVILGSATPSLTSYYRAERGEYVLLTLPQRIMGHRRIWDEQREEHQIPEARYRPRRVGPGYEDARYMELPPVQIVDLRQELRAGNRSIFSRALQVALHDTLAAKEQAILFLNRRGAATFVLCRDCGEVMTCPRCEIPLTYHANGERLICHRCGYHLPAPETCPQCHGKRIRFFGTGTEKVEEVTRQLFPSARVLRWDSDVIKEQGSHEALLTKFVNHEADILIGTQMIAKGLDLPLVTLVGVITADTILYLPDFQAGERTFQLLAQVAGRAGRSILGGKVIIQTYTPDHYAIQAASRHDYEGFYRHEMAFRRAHGYPPWGQLAKLVYTGKRDGEAARESERMSRLLRETQERLGLYDLELIGPAPCLFSPWQGRYRWQILVRGGDPHPLLEAVPLAPGWQVDIDPISTL